MKAAKTLGDASSREVAIDLRVGVMHKGKANIGTFETRRAGMWVGELG